MAINPYQAPEVARGVRQKARKVRIWLLPTIVVAVVGAIDVALFFIIPLLTPPRGTPGTFTVSALMTIGTLIDLPGLPLFLAIQTTGLIPRGVDDDYVQGIWFIGCSVVSWGILTWIGSWRYAQLKSYETSNGH